jgi:MOSC domain-containing protein
VTRPPQARVSVLSVTPIKGLALHHPDRITVTSGGVVGDRAFFLLDSAGELISCTELGELMQLRAAFDPETRVLELFQGTELLRSGLVEPGEPIVADFYGLRAVHGHVASGWSEVFSDVARQPLRLVEGTSGGYDVAGLTLLGEASVRELAARNSSEPVDARRFRINVEVAGTAPHEEDTWEGRLLNLGQAQLRVGGPVRRCAATTRNPDTGLVDLQTLRMIGTARGRQETADFGKGFYFGVYAEVTIPGPIQVGDLVAPLS